MRYISLLRGINVGGKNKVEMNRLKTLLESMDFKEVATYINSGNIIFQSNHNLDDVSQDIKENFVSEFGFDVPILIKTQQEIIQIESAIPTDWKNNKEQKTDVAYLFSEIDNIDTIDELPINKDFVDVRYISGAIFWNVKRENQTKSQLNKLAGHQLYKLMTVRNINTARYLSSWNV